MSKNNKCPSCRVRLSGESVKCPACGFGFHVLDDFYTSKRQTKTPLEAGLLTDKAGLLNSNERKACRKLLEAFSKRFPGLFFSVYLDSARELEEADSKCLWILNKANFTDLPEGAHPQYGFLLYIDANKKASALSFGVGLDRTIDSELTFSFLSSCHPEFYRGRYLNAIKKVLSKTSAHLSVKCPALKKSQDVV